MKKKVTSHKSQVTRMGSPGCRQAQQSGASPKGTSRGKIFVISGPSGSGKTTLRDRLFSDASLKKKLLKSISLTTRPKRTGETEGRDYFFVSRSGFLKGLKNKKILEWTRYLGHCYGTPKDFVDRALGSGKHLALCLDLKGAKAIKRIYKSAAVTVFVLPPSIEELESRITGRCSLTKKSELRRRLELAKKELAASKDFDFCVVNKKLTQAQKVLKRFILRKITP